MKKIFILILFIGLINLYSQDMQAETFSSSLVIEENEYNDDYDDDHDDDYDDDDDDECPSLPISNQQGLSILIVSGIVLAFFNKRKKRKQI